MPKSVSAKHVLRYDGGVNGLSSEPSLFTNEGHRVHVVAISSLQAHISCFFAANVDSRRKKRRALLVYLTDFLPRSAKKKRKESGWVTID